MTEFAKICKQIEEISSSLNNIQQNGCWGGHQGDVYGYGTALNGPIAEKMSKYKAKVEEPDPSKRLYGPAMEAKVKACLQSYEEVLQKFAQIAEEVSKNHQTFAAEQDKIVAEQQDRLKKEDQIKKLQQEEEERQKQEAELLRVQRLWEAALQEEKERQEIFARRQERERTACMQKEMESRQAIETAEKQERQKVEDDIRLRRQREEAREEKRRRLGTILEQHRQVKEKGEQQLIAEAIAMSLCETNPALPEAHEPAKAQPANDVEIEAVSEHKEEKVDLPPANDLETEDMLIKQAIELSLQLSAATQLTTHRQSNPRADKTPDAP